MGRLILIVLVLVLVLLAALITLAIVAVQQWGLIGLAGVVVAFFVLGLGVKKLATAALAKAFRAPFAMKGSVLKGAQVALHSVEPIDAPQPRHGDGDAVADVEDGEDDEDSVRRNYEWFRVEATLTPTATPTTFQMWEPGELLLTVPGAAPEPDDAAAEYPLEDLELSVDGGYRMDEGEKWGGEQRIRFIVGVPPGTERLIFRYYFELFGEVRFPRRVSA